MPSIRRLLIANRGEIAVRIARTARSEGIETVVAHAEDDAGAPFVLAADAAQPLPGTGPAAYLSVDGVVAAAQAAGCDAVHPGYGFLSENPALAEACREAGLTFVGPTVSRSRRSATSSVDGRRPRRPGCRCWLRPPAPPTSRPPRRSSTSTVR